MDRESNLGVLIFSYSQRVMCKKESQKKEAMISKKIFSLSAVIFALSWEGQFNSPKL